MNLVTKTFILFCFCTMPSYLLFAQKKLLEHPFIQRFIADKKDSTRSARLLVLPLLDYTQENGVEYGFTGALNYYTNKADSNIYTSSLNTAASLTTKKQFYLKLESDIWTTENKYHYITAIRYKKQPFNYFGLGDQTSVDDKMLLTQKYIQLNLEAEKKVAKHYYVGLNTQFESFEFIEKSQDESFNPNSIYGGSGGKYMAIGVSQSFDSRNSNTETIRGLYARVKYAYAPNFWGGDNYTGGIFSLDLRAFFPLHKKLILGIHSIYQTLFSNQVPFYLTNQLGNGGVMRGYYRGRYRDRTYLAGQSEIRYRIHPRIGLAAFVGTGTVYDTQIDLSDFKISKGGGIRYFFDLVHNSSLRIDYATGEKRPGEKRQGGFYISLGQAF